MTSLIRKLLLAAVCVMLLWPASARAQPGDKALAESLFRQGRDKMAAGQTEQACALFEESQRHEPSVGTLLNLALCYEKLGRTASAWAAFVQVAIEAERTNQHGRAEFSRERAEELDKQQSRLKIIVGERYYGLTVAVDGNEIPLPEQSAALPFDPGEHLVEASAPGWKSWKHVVQLPPGPNVLELALPPLEEQPAPPPQPPPPPPQQVPSPSPHPVAPPMDRQPDGGAGISPLVVVGFSLGGAALIVGAVTGGLSLKKSDDLLQSCQDKVCPESVRDDHSDAEALANASNVSFAIAAVGVAVGIVGLVLSDFSDGDVSATLGPTGGQLRVRF